MANASAFPPPPFAPPPPLVPAAGSSALISALVTSVVIASILGGLGECYRCRNQERSDRVFAPRLTRRAALRSAGGGDKLASAEAGDTAKGSELVAVSSTLPLEPPTTRPFSWVGAVFRATDEDLLPSCGVDAVLAVKFARAGFMVFLRTVLFDMTVVIWANYDGKKSLIAPSDMDPLTIGHLKNGSNLFYLHWISMTWKTLVVLYTLQHLSVWVSAAQADECEKRAARTEGRAVLLTDLPSLAEASATLTSLYGDDFVELLPAIDPVEATKLAARRDALVGLLESARYALENAKVPGTRPQHKTGLLGLVGPKVDSIDAYGRELVEVHGRLTVARALALTPASKLGDIEKLPLPPKKKKAKEGEEEAAAVEGGQHANPDAPLRNAGFASFATPKAAAVAAQCVLARGSTRFTVAPAPAPADVVWKNVGRVAGDRRSFVSTGVMAFLYAMVVFYMVPITIISAVSTLAQLSAILPFIKPVVSISIVSGILSGILPGLALLIFLALLPAIVKGLAYHRGIATNGGLEVGLLQGLFLFYVVNVFLGNVLIGSVFGALKQITSNPPSIVSLLATTIPGTSRFFMTFVALKAGGIMGGITVFIPQIIYKILGLLPGPMSARRAAGMWKPASSSWGCDMSDMLLVWLLMLIFTTLAPIMQGAAMVYFGARVFNAKASILFRHEPGYESNARLWPAARARVIFCMYVSQITLVVVLALKAAPGPAVLVAILVPITSVASHIFASMYDAYAPHLPQPLQSYGPLPVDGGLCVPTSEVAPAFVAPALQLPDENLAAPLEAELAAAALLPPLKDGAGGRGDTTPTRLTTSGGRGATESDGLLRATSLAQQGGAAAAGAPAAVQAQAAAAPPPAVAVAPGAVAGETAEVTAATAAASAASADKPKVFANSWQRLDESARTPTGATAFSATSIIAATNKEAAAKIKADSPKAGSPKAPRVDDEFLDAETGDN